MRALFTFLITSYLVCLSSHVRNMCFRPAWQQEEASWILDVFYERNGQKIEGSNDRFIMSKQLGNK